MGSDQIDRILQHSRIALDTNIFVYALENNPEFPQAGEFFRRLERSNIEIFTSILSVLETTVPLYKAGEKQRIPDYLEFISGQGRITIADIGRSITLKAAELRAKYRYSTPDAIQVATAIIHNMELFVTADKGFKTQTIENLKIVTIRSRSIKSA